MGHPPLRESPEWGVGVGGHPRFLSETSAEKPRGLWFGEGGVSLFCGGHLCRGMRGGIFGPPPSILRSVLWDGGPWAEGDKGRGDSRGHPFCEGGRSPSWGGFHRTHKILALTLGC